MQTGSWQAGDFDGTGRTDLVHLCCSDYAHVWFSGGVAGFDITSFSPWPGYNLQRGHWGAGDFNSDGSRDLLHMCCEDYGHQWLASPH
jgi:hypothetical protein